jgi:alpha-N-acetylglucosaminidase
MWYSPRDAAVALQYLLASADALTLSKPYRYDVVDLTRQVLSKLANQLHSEVVEDYKLSNVEKVENASRLLLELLCDMDELLGASEEFLLGPWLESAKALGTTDDEKKLVSLGGHPLINS